MLTVFLFLILFRTLVALRVSLSMCFTAIVIFSLAFWALLRSGRGMASPPLPRPLMRNRFHNGGTAGKVSSSENALKENPGGAAAESAGVGRV